MKPGDDVHELKSIIDNVQNLKVLVIDDKVSMRRTVKNMLRTLGFARFNDAEDGRMAWRMIQNEKFDLIICDWNMPKMKGVDLLKTLRQDERFSRIPFLMLTGEVEEGKVAESIEADVDAYVIKPFQVSTLEDKITRILSNQAAPTPLEIQFQLADVYIQGCNYSKAHEELDKAALISRSSPKLHYYRGLVFEAQGKHVEAEKCYKKSRQLGPLFIKAHEKLVDLYEKKGLTADAALLLIEMVKISPRNAGRQARLGKALLAENRIIDAKKAFNNAVKLDPYNDDRILDIGETYLKHRLPQEADELFQLYLKERSSDAEAYNKLGMMLRKHKYYDNAIQYYKKALTADPEEVYLHFNLARVYIEIQRIDMAEVHLKKALSIQPDFDEAKALMLHLRRPKQASVN